MTEFHDFKGHPLAEELDKRVTRIVRTMALFRYGTFSLYRAQLSLIHDLLALEDSLKSYHSKESTLRKCATEVAVTAKHEGKALTEEQKQRIKALQQEADNYAYAIRLLRYGRWMYRYVGDGIAWRAYNYHREAIRALGGKEPVPFLSKKEGIDKELNLFKAIRRLGCQWLPLMHDLTNCIRTADLSVFKDGMLFRIIELKIRQSQPGNTPTMPPRSRGSQRETRQEQRLQNILGFFQSGDLRKLSPELGGGKSIRSKVPERHNFAALSRSMKEARRRGLGFDQPEPGILYVAWDDRENAVDEAIKQASKAHPHIFETLITFRSINPRSDHYHDILPITAMDLKSREITDLLFGRIGLVCIMNFGLIEQYCCEKGVTLHFHHSPSAPIKIIVDSKPHQGEVREGLWDRLLLEALSLDSFTGLIKATMNEYDLSE